MIKKYEERYGELVRRLQEAAEKLREVGAAIEDCQKRKGAEAQLFELEQKAMGLTSDLQSLRGQVEQVGGLIKQLKAEEREKLKERLKELEGAEAEAQA